MSFVPDTRGIVGCAVRAASDRGAGLGEPAGELAQHVQREAGLRLDEREEVVPGNRDAAHRRRRPHTRDTRAVVDEKGELAEEVARPELELAHAKLDLDVAVAEHEHACARVALEGKHLTAGGLQLGRAHSEPLKPDVRQARERRKAAQLLDIHVTCLYQYACLVRAFDTRLPLYGEDRERGDLRD